MTDLVNVMEAQPHQHVRHLLRYRGLDECYLMADRDRIYAAYFPSGGQVSVDVSAVEDSIYVRWLETDTVEWADDWIEAETDDNGLIELDAPGDHWVAIIASQPLR